MSGARRRFGSTAAWVVCSGPAGGTEPRDALAVGAFGDSFVSRAGQNNISVLLIR